MHKGLNCSFIKIIKCNDGRDGFKFSNTVSFFFNREAKRPQTKDAAMEVEASESEDVGDVLCRVPSDDPEQEESMETHVSGEEAAADQGSETNPPLKPQYSYRLVKSFTARFGLLRFAKNIKVLFSLCKSCVWIHLE